MKTLPVEAVPKIQFLAQTLLRFSQNFSFWESCHEKCVFRSLQTGGSLARNRKSFPKPTGFWENLIERL